MGLSSSINLQLSMGLHIAWTYTLGHNRNVSEVTVSGIPFDRSLLFIHHSGQLGGTSSPSGSQGSLSREVLECPTPHFEGGRKRGDYQRA